MPDQAESPPKAGGNNEFYQFMSNPRGFTLRRWFYDLVGPGYKEHEDVIDRVSSALTTDKDLKAFGSLITDVYRGGYVKAVSDYKGTLEGMGLSVSVSPHGPPPSAERGTDV